MTTSWTSDELERIESADELRIQPRLADGTLRRPTPIWVVRDGDGLYIRSYRGGDGAWYRATQVSGEGLVHSGGVTKDVSFVPETDHDVNNRIDAAYGSKYDRHSATYVAPMVTAPARATTLRLVPR